MLKSFQDVTANSPTALVEAIAAGPVSVAVNAGSLGFQFYRGGILKRFCGTSLDHGVVAVGYGSENGSDYYLVRNSWGAGWGENGYIRIARDMTKDSAGVCGIQMMASYPIV